MSGKPAFGFDPPVRNEERYPDLKIGCSETDTSIFRLHEDVAEDGQRSTAGDGMADGLNGFEKVFARADRAQSRSGCFKGGRHPVLQWLVAHVRASLRTTRAESKMCRMIF